MSTNKSEKLNELLAQQQTIIQAIKLEADELDSSKIIEQNEKLNAELALVREKQESLQADNAQLKKELETAKQALFSKMANEKLTAFLNTQKKIDALYYTQSNALGSRLNEYEAQCTNTINETIKAIDSYGSEQFSDIRVRLEQIKAELNERSRAVHEEYNSRLQSALNENNRKGSELYNEPLQEIEKQRALKQKSLESFVGLNILSKAGILLFLVGIVMLGRFAYIHLSDVFKTGMIFLLGAVLIGVGELFFRKEKSVFSTVLISGGSAVLYAAAATGYFAFSLYSVQVTFILCVIITALTIFLANQVRSQVICVFAAIGGYLPVVVSYMVGFGKAASDSSFLPVSSVYFILLAVVLFIMSYNKKWHIARFTGYGLQIVAVGGVALSAWAVRGLKGYSYALPLAVIFAAASFLIYLLYPSYLVIKKKPLAMLDNILLAINTVSGAVSVSFCVRNCFYGNTQAGDRAVGLVFLVFTVIYGILAFFSVKNRETQKQSVTANISALFTLVFSMFIVPLLFGIDYAPIAWALEGVAIAVVSLEKKLKYSEYAGLVCMVISAVTYYIALYNTGDWHSVLSLISFVTVVAAFWAYIVRGLIDDNENKLYILLEILNSFASVALLDFIFGLIVSSKYINVSSPFTEGAVLLLFSLLVAAAIRFGVLKNKVSLIASDLAGAFLVIALLALNAEKYNEVYDFYYVLTAKSWLSVVNLILLLALAVGIEFFFSVCAAHFISVIKGPAWLFTVSVSVTSLAVISVTLMKQFSLPFASVIISAVYIAAACVLLAVGFKKDYTVVRSGGLVLILAAFAKLCFADTAKLDSGWKIASYFAFGAILIVISYFYQRFTKKLEKNSEKLIDDSSDAE